MDTRFPLLRIEKTLPSMDGYPVNADFANLMIEQILTRRPEFILELGSGVSTLFSGYSLQKLGVGKVISLEHDPHYYKETAQFIREHELTSWVELIFAPLVPYTILGQTFQWYSTEPFRNYLSFDMLVVDGPPGHLQSMSRYPALPILSPRLSPHAVLLCDDANRKDEQLMRDHWLKEYPDWEHEYLPTESGAFLFTKKAHSG